MLGKEYIKAVYCHPAYLTSMQSPSKFSSVAQSCPTLCNPRNRSMPGLPVHHQLPESTQTHVQEREFPCDPVIRTLGQG